MKTESSAPASDTHPVTELVRVSAFRRHLAQSASANESQLGGTRLSSLSPSLQQDLMRFEQGASNGAGIELLEVLAAAMRHAKPLLLSLKFGARVLPLTIFPIERQAHCPVPLDQLLDLPLSTLSVLHIEPARLPALSERDAARADQAVAYWALGPLLWGLALHGSRAGLLPEIAGKAAYRVAPGADLSQLQTSPSVAQALKRLRMESTNLHTMAAWPGIGEALAQRMLNGLYLQAALMVSRTHPAATNADWQGSA